MENERPSQFRWFSATAIKVMLALLGMLVVVLLLGALVLLIWGVPLGPYWLVNWGNVASVLGLFVSFFGLALAMALAKEAVTASRAAEEAAKEARESVYNFDSIVELTKATILLAQVTDYHQRGEWQRLPHLYAEIRALLVSLTSDASRLSALQRTSVTDVRLILKDFDDKIGAFLQSQREGSPPKSGGWLSLLKEQSDKLSLLLANLRAAQGV